MKVPLEIPLIIVAGVVVINLVAIVRDYVNRTKLARPSSNPAELDALRNRIDAFERQLQEQDAKVQRLKADVSFTTKLLEKKG